MITISVAVTADTLQGAKDALTTANQRASTLEMSQIVTLGNLGKTETDEEHSAFSIHISEIPQLKVTPR